MRVIELDSSISRAKFSSVGRGENFYHGDRLYLKCEAHIPTAGLVQNCGGLMTPFGVCLATGQVKPLEGDCIVTLARARVEVELYGRA